MALGTLRCHSTGKDLLGQRNVLYKNSLLPPSSLPSISLTLTETSYSLSLSTEYHTIVLLLSAKIQALLFLRSIAAL